MTRGEFESAAMLLLAPAIVVVALGVWAYDAARRAVTGR